MRHKRFAVMTLLCAAPMCRPGYAEQPSASKLPMERAASGRTEPKRPELQHRAPAKLPLPSKPHARSRVQSPPNPYPASARSATAGRSTVAGKNELTPIRPGGQQSLRRPVASPLSTVRHRGPNPPAISGTSERFKENAAALDGRGVRARF